MVLSSSQATFPKKSPTGHGAASSGGGQIQSLLRGGTFEVQSAMLAPVQRSPGLGLGPGAGIFEPSPVEAAPEPPDASALRAARKAIAEGSQRWDDATPTKKQHERIRSAIDDCDASAGAELLDVFAERHDALRAAIDKTHGELAAYERELAARGIEDWIVTEEYTGMGPSDQEARVARLMLERAEDHLEAFGEALRFLSVPGATPAADASQPVAAHLATVKADLALADALRSDALLALVGGTDKARAVGARIGQAPPGLQAHVMHVIGRVGAAAGKEKRSRNSRKAAAQETQKQGRYQSFVTMFEALAIPLADFSQYLEAMGDSSDESFAESLRNLTPVGKDVLDTLRAGERDPDEIVFELFESDKPAPSTLVRKGAGARGPITHPAVSVVANDMERVVVHALTFAHQLRAARASGDEGAAAKAASSLTAVRATPAHADFLREHLTDGGLGDKVARLLVAIRAGVDAKGSLCFQPSQAAPPSNEGAAVSREQIEAALARQDALVEGQLAEIGLSFIAERHSALELFHKTYGLSRKPDDAGAQLDLANAASGAIAETLEYSSERAADYAKEAMKDAATAHKAVRAERFVTNAAPYIDLLGAAGTGLEVISIVRNLGVVLDAKTSHFERTNAAIDIAASGASLVGTATSTSAALAMPVAAIVAYLKLLNVSFQRLAARDASSRAKRQREALSVLLGSGADAAEYTGMVVEALAQKPANDGLAKVYTGKARPKFGAIMSAMKPDTSMPGMAIHWSGWTAQQAWCRELLVTAGVPRLAQSGLAPEVLVAKSQAALEAIKEAADALTRLLEDYLGERTDGDAG